MESLRQTVLIINYVDLPKDVKKAVRNWCGVFSNDVILRVRSEFDVQSWRVGMSEIESYWHAQTELNGYKGNLTQFIKDYGLEFDVWIIGQNFDLSGIDQVLINVCW